MRATARCKERVQGSGHDDGRMRRGEGLVSGEQRTLNMACMSVTLEVSQLEISALKLDSWEKRLFMSVT